MTGFTYPVAKYFLEDAVLCTGYEDAKEGDNGGRGYGGMVLILSLTAQRRQASFFGVPQVRRSGEIQSLGQTESD